MKELIRFIIKIICKIYTPQAHKYFINLKNRLYSIYISNSFSHAGRPLLIIKPITLIGGKQINIGNNISIGRFSTITAFTKRKHQSFNPTIIIGDDCNIGEYNHITCINTIVR